jgi:hypothetical protein
MISTCLALAITLVFQQTPKRVLCIGDSVTQAYAPILKQILSPRKMEVEILNDGSGHLDIGRILLPSKMRLDVVVIGFGTDLAADPKWSGMRDRFVPKMEALIDSLRSGISHPSVYLCLPPPSALPDSDLRSQRLASELTPLLKQAARESNCPIIDFEAALRDRLDLVSGLSPKGLGAEVLADTVADAVSTGKKADWRVVYADSEEADEGPAKFAIDGDPDTYWHTNYSTTQEHYPHEIQVDIGALTTIGGFSYLPRQDGVNGRVAKYEFYVSRDGKTWGNPVASGAFAHTSDVTKVHFGNPVECRYFRFRALSEQQGQIWASVGELDILKFYPKRP